MAPSPSVSWRPANLVSPSPPAILEFDFRGTRARWCCAACAGSGSAPGGPLPRMTVFVRALSVHQGRQRMTRHVSVGKRMTASAHRREPVIFHHGLLCGPRRTRCAAQFLRRRADDLIRRVERGGARRGACHLLARQAVQPPGEVDERRHLRGLCTVAADPPRRCMRSGRCRRSTRRA